MVFSTGAAVSRALWHQCRSVPTLRHYVGTGAEVSCDTLALVLYLCQTILAKVSCCQSVQYFAPCPESRHVGVTPTVSFSVKYSTMVVANRQPCNAMIFQKVYCDRLLLAY